MRALGWVGWGLFAWSVVASAMFHDLKLQQLREVRRYVAATCTDGIPPEDFHTEGLDHSLHGYIGPELLELCHVVRRQYESIAAEDLQHQGVQWRSELKEASWR